MKKGSYFDCWVNMKAKIALNEPNTDLQYVDFPFVK